MQRRKFVKKTLTQLPLVLLLPTLIAACGEDVEIVVPNGKTVVVVGAGIAGLAAAIRLKANGFTVIVLESQERPGGRIRTDRSLGVAFDEGASWVHGPDGNPITGLAFKSDALIFQTDDDSVVVYDKFGIAYNDSTLSAEEKQFDKAVKAVESAGSKDASFETVFKFLYSSQTNDPLWKYFLSAYLEFDTGGDISELSSEYFYDDEEFSGEDVIVTNGYDHITDYLARDLDVRLSTRVNHIDYAQDKIVIKANDESHEADYVIVTVPLGVLKNKLISFAPALPDEMSLAIDNTQMGVVNKFLFTWDTPFWDTNLQYIGFTPDTKGKFNYFLNIAKFTETNGLMTFAFGDYATITESMPDGQIVAEVMQHLKTIYGDAIPEPSNMLRTKWGQNVNSYGSYSFATKGTTTEDFDTMANAVNDKLFFAGEHTERDYRGTVHGAYLSGIREADKIISL